MDVKNTTIEEFVGPLPVRPTRAERRKLIRETERRIMNTTEPKGALRCAVCDKSARGMIQPTGQERRPMCATHLARAMFGR